MYKIKKWQYVFYKHALLHGLNICVAIHSSTTLLTIPSSTTPTTPTSSSSTSSTWSLASLLGREGHGDRVALYWVALNTAYVLEFFLQSLVRKKAMAQKTHLVINALLMGVSTYAALPLLAFVGWKIPLASLIANFTNRKHDVANTTLIALIALSAHLYSSIPTQSKP